MIGAADFLGDWALSRRIEDARAGAGGRFEGAAVFTEAGPGLLRYEERGGLRMGTGPVLTAERRYLWRFEGARVAVLFEDGRAFHGFDPAGRPEASHWCDPDAYAVRYDFADWPRWRAVWRVTGPRKDYVMDSAYARA